MTLSRTTGLLLALLLGTVALPAGADGVAGPYLAGQVASIDSDYRAAADYYTRALVADPTNYSVMESAMLADVAIGDFDMARKLANGLDAAGRKSGLADLIELVTTIATRLDALGDPPPDLAEASRDVRPEQVIRRIDEAGR